VLHVEQDPPLPATMQGPREFAERLFTDLVAQIVGHLLRFRHQAECVVHGCDRNQFPRPSAAGRSAGHRAVHGASPSHCDTRHTAPLARATCDRSSACAERLRSSSVRLRGGGRGRIGRCAATAPRGRHRRSPARTGRRTAVEACRMSSSCSASGASSSACRLLGRRREIAVDARPQRQSWKTLPPCISTSRRSGSGGARRTSCRIWPIAATAAVASASAGGPARRHELLPQGVSLQIQDSPRTRGRRRWNESSPSSQARPKQNHRSGRGSGDPAAAAAAVRLHGHRRHRALFDRLVDVAVEVQRSSGGPLLGAGRCRVGIVAVDITREGSQALCRGRPRIRTRPQQLRGGRLGFPGR